MNPLTANEIKCALINTTEERSEQRLYGSMWPMYLKSM